MERKCIHQPQNLILEKSSILAKMKKGMSRNDVSLRPFAELLLTTLKIEKRNSYVETTHSKVCLLITEP